MTRDLPWPWRCDDRPRGWFKAMGGYKFGPLPQREASKEPTWPPRRMEAAIVGAPDDPWGEARDHFSAVVNSLEKRG